jgi:K+-sensing histidine kinase KdpD
MKNSLGMLLNSLEEIIRDTPVKDESQSARFGVLQYEASRISTELIQLLSIYRMQNDRMPVQIDEQYPVETLEEQVARNDMLFEMRGLDIVVDCDEDLCWYYDAELVGGVIHNILVNGARYSKSKMALSARIENNELVLSVADDGNGYPAFMLGSPEQSFAKSVSFSEGNTHLGLYFASEVAHMHVRDGRHGRIELSNGGELGGGLFSLYLP